MNTIHTLIFSLALGVTSTALAHGDNTLQSENAFFSGTDTDAAKVVVAFHQALESGDSVKARALLADDVLIVEGSRIERSADEYAQHHMVADMKYLNSVETRIIEHQVKVVEPIAISISRSATKGVFKGKTIDQQSNETITLVKGSNGWKITHIHWSH